MHPSSHRYPLALQSWHAVTLAAVTAMGVVAASQDGAAEAAEQGAGGEGTAPRVLVLGTGGGSVPSFLSRFVPQVSSCDFAGP